MISTEYVEFGRLLVAYRGVLYAKVLAADVLTSFLQSRSGRSGVLAR